MNGMRASFMVAGIEKLSNLTNLDISNNKFTTIPEESLPSGLVELTVTGCQLTELPARIGTLPRLRKLFAGANKWVIWALRGWVTAGLGQAYRHWRRVKGGSVAQGRMAWVSRQSLRAAPTDPQQERACWEWQRAPLALVPIAPGSPHARVAGCRPHTHTLIGPHSPAPSPPSLG